MSGLHGVTFSYGDHLVLNHATLVLPRSGCVCLFGPSGCGKTTALHLLAGLLRAQGGRVDVPRRITMVFQEDRLLPWLDALGNVCLPPGVGRGAAGAMLEMLGIHEIEGKPVVNMSGGQKRRVAIARALAAQGELLLLDEPFRGLDEAAKADAAQLVRHRADKMPCVLVTHDREEAALLDATVVAVRDGGFT